MDELHLTKKDFKLEWYSGQGAGGQHRNKHENCCRITHIESGLSQNGTESKSRVTNQRTAFNKLAKQVIAWYNTEDDKERFNATKTIRNYHAVRNEVHDKASGLKQSYKKVVLEADMADMIEARKMSMGASDDENN